MQSDRGRVTDESVAGGAIEQLMTADEVAAALGVNRKFVYARHRSGALRGYKLGPQFRFRRSDVEAFVEASLAVPDAPRRPAERATRTAPAGTFRALLERSAT